MKLLYCIDERGLKGGAHIATELLISALREKGHQVDVMEAIRRNSFWGYCQRAYLRIFPRRCLPLFLRDPWGTRRRKMRSYDTVCVMSETSTFSALVATLPASVRKVQMIHTNYPMWAKLAKRDTAADERLFVWMDCIACVGKIGAQQFAEMFPALREKVVPFYNLIDQTGLKYRVKKPHDGPMRIISLARIDDRGAKDGPRMIRVAKRLKDAGVDFIWDNYGGGGNGLEACKAEVERIGLSGIFNIHGYVAHAREKIAEADLFVLLSHYEGLPNVIYEALLSGTPVLATRVGGIPEQIEDSVNGWLVEDNEELIAKRMVGEIERRTGILRANEALSAYVYDNVSVVQKHEDFLTSHVKSFG